MEVQNPVPRITERSVSLPTIIIYTSHTHTHTQREREREREHTEGGRSTSYMSFRLSHSMISSYSIQQNNASTSEDLQSSNNFFMTALCIATWPSVISKKRLRLVPGHNKLRSSSGKRVGSFVGCWVGDEVVDTSDGSLVGSSISCWVGGKGGFFCKFIGRFER